MLRYSSAFLNHLNTTSVLLKVHAYPSMPVMFLLCLHPQNINVGLTREVPFPNTVNCTMLCRFSRPEAIFTIPHQLPWYHAFDHYPIQKAVAFDPCLLSLPVETCLGFVLLIVSH